MSNYRRGDVVTVLFPFSDGLGAKRRPAVIVREDPPGVFLICQITTNLGRASKSKGCIVKKASEEGARMGIDSDSFINAEISICVEAFAFYEKIGTYSGIQTIEALMP